MSATTNPIVSGNIGMLGGDAAALSGSLRRSSIMWIGDSLTWYGGGERNPLLPDSAQTNSVVLSLPTINAVGNFVRAHAFDCNYTPVGAGTLKYYVADTTMTWTSLGDTEGARVDVSTGGFFYVPSATASLGGAYLMIGPSSLRPVGNASDTVTTTSGMSNNWTYLNGFSGMWEAYRGFPFDVSKTYAISGATTTEVLLWQNQWNTIFSDITVINVGVNDQPTIAQVPTTLANIQNIVQQRQLIGSIPIVMLMFPNSADTLTQKRADLELNHLLANWCRTNGIRYCSSYQQLSDWTSANPAVRSGMFSDGVHLTGPGALVVAKYVLDPVLYPLVNVLPQRNEAQQTYDSSLNPHGNLLTNGGLTGTGGVADTGTSGTVPTSWTTKRTTGAVLTAVSAAPSAGGEARTDNSIVMPWWRITVDNSAGITGEVLQVYQTTGVSGSNYSAGDQIVMSGEVRISGANIQMLSAELASFPTAKSINHRAFGVDPSTANPLGDLAGETLTIPFRSRPFTVPVGGASGLIPRFTLTMLATGTATLDIGPVSVRKI